MWLEVAWRQRRQLFDFLPVTIASKVEISDTSTLRFGTIHLEVFPVLKRNRKNFFSSECLQPEGITDDIKFLCSWKCLSLGYPVLS